MRQHDEEDEEDLRTYAEVFDRLTDEEPRPPRRLEQLMTEGRRRLAELGDRLRDESGTLAHRVRAWLATLPRWHRSGSPLPSPLLRSEPSLLVGLASFAFAFTVAWWTGGPIDVAGDRSPAPVAEQAVPAVTATLPPRAHQAAWDVAQVLRSAEASEATKLAVVDELAKDPSEGATKALIAGIGADSLYVSMACLRALSGRPCDAVATSLARRLDDPLWQRRAWAARVLGANECAGAGTRLAQRLAVEPDARVQQQLQLAIDSLKEPGA